MSDVGRYRKVYPRIWRHSGFRRLCETAQRIALYLVSGPQTNRIGLFCFSIATAAEDLKVSVETFRKRLPDVQTTFAWQYDAEARVFFVPSWWRWNHPENSNVLQGNLKDLNDVPLCALVEAFAGNLETLDPTFHQTFVEGCGRYLHKRSSDQEQYQDLDQEKKQKPGASRRTAKSAENGNGAFETSKLDRVVRRASEHFGRDEDVEFSLASGTLPMPGMR
jgi:hypothetical protein